jgi:hypothetical protein
LIRKIWHPYTRWECIGMFVDKWNGNDDEAIQKYIELLTDLEMFKNVMAKVIKLWPISCEHFLTKTNMNRIAWLGQASLYFHAGIERKYRIGFKKLSYLEQNNANLVAKECLDNYLSKMKRHKNTKNGTEFYHFKYDGVKSRVNVYESVWRNRGYQDGIPEEVPSELMLLNLAPSWKAVSIALLKNDICLYSLGFSVKKTEYYNMLKKIEIGQRIDKNKKI